MRLRGIFDRGAPTPRSGCCQSSYSHPAAARVEPLEERRLFSGAHQDLHELIGPAVPEPTGTLTSVGDSDEYTFSVPAPADVDVFVDGDHGNMGGVRAIELRDSTGLLVRRSELSAGARLSTTFSFAGKVPAGTYTLKVRRLEEFPAGALNYTLHLATDLAGDETEVRSARIGGMVDDSMTFNDGFQSVESIRDDLVDTYGFYVLTDRSVTAAVRGLSPGNYTLDFLQDVDGDGEPEAIASEAFTGGSHQMTRVVAGGGDGRGGGFGRGAPPNLYVRLTCDSEPNTPGYLLTVSPENRRPDPVPLPGVRGSVAGMLFDDIDGNRRKSKAEGPLAGVRVYLDGDDDGAHDQGEPAATTGDDGSFTIANVMPGSYHLRTELPGRWSGADVPVTVPAKHGKLPKLRPIGVTARGGLVGSIFADRNNNGTPDPGERPVRGARVFLDANGDGVWQKRDERAVKVDRRGNWLMPGLPGGTHRVGVLARNVRLPPRVVTLEEGRTQQIYFAAATGNPGRRGRG